MPMHTRGNLRASFHGKSELLQYPLCEDAFREGGTTLPVRKRNASFRKAQRCDWTLALLQWSQFSAGFENSVGLLLFASMRFWLPWEPPLWCSDGQHVWLTLGKGTVTLWHPFRKKHRKENRIYGPLKIKGDCLTSTSGWTWGPGLAVLKRAQAGCLGAAFSFEWCSSIHTCNLLTTFVNM